MVRIQGRVAVKYSLLLYTVFCIIACLNLITVCEMGKIPRYPLTHSLSLIPSLPTPLLLQVWPPRLLGAG